MHSNVLKLTNALFVVLICALFLQTGITAAWAVEPKQAKPASVSVPKAGKAQSNTPSQLSAATSIKNWSPYLDVAYELTYWDKAEIKDWREKRDAEIGETLAAYRSAWSVKLTGSPDSAVSPAGREGQPSVVRDRDYLRLAIAQTIDYLQSDNKESLDSASQLLEKLKDKSAMPEIAYWISYVKALQALEDTDSKNASEKFVTQVFNIWNHAALYYEQSEIGRKPADRIGSSVATYYYRNLVNLVVSRAIINKKMENLNALGPLFLMLIERDLGDKDGEGKYFTTLVKRIAEGLTAPDSDRYRLNFTVAVMESKRLQQVTRAKLDSEGMSVAARKAFEQVLVYNELAFNWAESLRSSGYASATVDLLDITSFAIQRLPENEKAPEYKFFALLPNEKDFATLLKGMTVFNDIGVHSGAGWEKAGYANRKLYMLATHELWRAIMELSLWTGDYHLARLNSPNATQAMKVLAEPLQVVLDSYLNFLSTQNSRGFKDIVPDSAYFGAAEAAEKLAYAYHKVNMYSMDDVAYNRWILHRLQATELFPMSPREAYQTSAALRQDGRYNLFLEYFLPLAGRVKQSPAIKKWLDGQKPEDPVTVLVRDYVNSIDQVFAPVTESAPNKGVKGNGDSQFVAPFQQLREEMQRKPDHPVHRLLKDFYMEEMQKNTPYTQLLKDPNRLRQVL